QLHLSENQIRQQRAVLLVEEETVLQRAATAFMNVLIDEILLDYSRQYRDALRRIEEATARLEKTGDRTLGELALVRQRLAGAEARETEARSALEQARVVYRQVVGDFPGTLKIPQALDIVPPSLQEAEAIAVQANADLVQATYALLAANDQISVES